MPTCLMNPRQWSQKMFGHAELGDSRRTQRLVTYAAAQAGDASGSTLSVCKGDVAAAEGAYRLIRNDHVLPSAIASSGFEAAALKFKASSATALVIQDTTTMSYSTRLGVELGTIGGKGHKNQGMLVHSSLAVDAYSGATLGLLDQDRWIRKAAQPQVAEAVDAKMEAGPTPGAKAKGVKSKKPKVAAADLESAKWQRADERVAVRLGAAMARTITVCDREGDFAAFIRDKLGRGERFVLRAKHDRQVDAKEARNLWPLLDKMPRVGTAVIEVPQRGGLQGRPRRSVTVAVHAGVVSVRLPGDAKTVPAHQIGVVWAHEEHPPAGVEAVDWRLLTTEPVHNSPAALQVLKWYALRWRIEDFHRAWKTGCGAEDRRQHAADNLERVLVVLAFIAVRLLQLRDLHDVDPTVTCEIVLTRVQWRCLWVTVEGKKPLPKQAPDARWACRAIAKMGGWLGRKSDARPGWETLWRGWYRLDERVQGVLLATQIV